jgi:hypothetical protein
MVLDGFGHLSGLDVGFTILIGGGAADLQGRWQERADMASRVAALSSRLLVSSLS